MLYVILTENSEISGKVKPQWGMLIIRYKYQNILHGINSSHYDL